MRIFDIFKKQNNGNNQKTDVVRKQETQKLLRSLNIPYIDHLPLVEAEGEAKIRTAQEVAKRILILTYLNLVSEDSEVREKVISFLETNSLWEKVSSEEKELFQKDELNEQEVVNISWRSEAIWLLLWVINKVDRLGLPIEPVEVDEIMSRLPGFFDDPKEFIDNARLQSTKEILNISDLTYRLHWATKNADSNNQPMPASLNSSVVSERHYAINWVTYYAEDWDEITTDT